MWLPGRELGWKDFFKNLKQEYQRDQIGNVAAALTFFGVLALFPFLLFMVALASILIDPKTAQVLIDELGRVAPPSAVDIVGERLRALGEQREVGLLTFGGAAALFSASGGIVSLMEALNSAYGVKESRSVWKVRGIAFAMTIAAALFSILSALLAVAAPAAASAIGGPLEDVIIWARLPVAGFLMMLVWALLYYFLPDVEQEFRFITPGSVVGVVVWLIASWGFSFYVARFGKYDATYGALGGVIVMLLWMWISAQVLLIGAEINAIIEHRSPEGKAPGAKSLDESDVQATKTELESSGGALEAPPPAGPLRAPVPKSAQAPQPAKWMQVALGAAFLGALWRVSRTAKR
jgi:membrane protein